MSCQCKCLTIKGEKGIAGPMGYPGLRGDKGMRGIPGPCGATGMPGLDGTFNDSIYGISGIMILEYYFERMVYDYVKLFHVNIPRVIVTWMLRYLKPKPKPKPKPKLKTKPRYDMRWS